MKLTGSLSGSQTLTGSLNGGGILNGALSTAPGQGTKDYNRLINKPTINSITVEGDKFGSDYNLQNKMETLSIQEIEKILYLD